MYWDVISVIPMMRRGEEKTRTMEKCGICGKEVREQPMVTEEGTCNQCGAKLDMSREK